MKIFTAFFIAIICLVLSQMPIKAENYWQSTNGPKGGDVNSVAVNSKNEIFIIEDLYNIFKSTDNGETWKLLYHSDDWLFYIRIDKSDNIYIIGELWFLLFSPDNGKTWEGKYQPCSDFYLLFFEATGNGNLFLETRDRQFYISTDHGDTWSNKELDIEYDSYLPNLCFDSFNNAYCCLISDTIKLFKSSTPYTDWNPILEYSMKNGEYSSGLLSINRKNHILAIPCTGKGKISFDGGQNFEDIKIFDKYSFISLLLTDDDKIILGTDGGIYRSIDTGKTWSRVTEPYRNIFSQNFIQFNDSTIIGNDWSNYFIKSTDYGLNWEQVDLNAGFKTVFSMGFDSSNVLYACTFSHNIYGIVNLV
jgi:photosystem II stability/assembly factor-like uncharacterized protein